ncbi:MAG: UDP-N-acetylmuramate--L-alanine ligase [Anaerolineales bacterium]|jgi:UDP-N-acetylmuramate--alanine ligase|nr:UDP-N-acetylmuramate--L-alanine ligase [Anaerolineales bacterium]
MVQHVHFIGIGGTGLSAIALVLLERGIPVSGSDRQASQQTYRLQAAGARIFIGHDPLNLHGVDLVVRSSAIPDSNPEVQAARALGLPVFKRIDYLGQLTAGSSTIAVAGTHGKTTTTSMIAWMLTDLGLDPSFIIGSTSVNLGVNAHAGFGKYFVIEADEYDRMFHGLQPFLAVVTNIEYDHPDCFPTPEAYFDAFQQFARQLAPGGVLIVCGDQLSARQLAKSAAVPTLLYGVDDPGNTYQAQSAYPNSRGGYDFVAVRSKLPSLGQAMPGNQRQAVHLQAPGRHNVQNAMAALAVADQLGLDWARAAKALETYAGAERRFELRGEAAGVTVIDDYAHHPTEIQATLQAARDRYPQRRLWVVWQPHTYSRTRTLLGEFAASFGDRTYSPVDQIVVTAIYPAREDKPQDGFSAAQVVAQIDHPEVRYLPELSQVSGYLLDHLQHGDVLLVLSAGDASQVSLDVLNGLEAARGQKANV